MTQRSVSLTRTVRRMGRGRRAKQALPVAESFSMPALRARGAPALPVARAFCRPVSYVLPGTFPTRAHPEATTAWAAALTVLLSWRDDKAYTVEQALERLGPKWVALYQARRPLSGEDLSVLCATVNLCRTEPQSPSASGWESLLRTYGPVALLPASGDETVNVHLALVLGVSGDGTPEGTLLTVYETSGGASATRPLSDFPGPFRLLHFHADAALGRGTKPLAPAPTAPGQEAPRNGETGATPAGPPPTAQSLALRQRRYARAASVPSWDLPANFPDKLRAFWARPAVRLHHYLWHMVRFSGVAGLSPADAKAFSAAGFGAPPRLSPRSGSPDAGAGIDFLGMHREMMATTRSIATKLGVPYRPTGWDPIPFDHSDPVWPMPAVNLSSLSKQKSRTLAMKALSESLRDSAKLATVSLDELGSSIETGIHGWMHMHWADAEPGNLFDTAPSNDWLGFFFTSQVNPIFWKLHGWVDACIDAWEKAKPGRNAASELAGAWLGPVPRASSFSNGHEHGLLTDELASELIAGLTAPTEPSFPFAELPESELFAMLGTFGESATQRLAQLQQEEGEQVQTASLPRGWMPVGTERHGVRGQRSQQMAGPLAIAELGIAVFSAVQPLVSGGDLSYDAAIAEYVHPHTPPETPGLRTTFDLKIIASHPRLGISNPKLWFQVQYEHNGYDLKACRIDVLRDKSSSLYTSTFHISFRPVASSPPSDPEARIDYLISGRWDPFGSGDYSFEGKLTLRANGAATATISRADENRVYIESDGIQNLRRTNLPGPIVITPFWDVYFSPPGSDTLTEAAQREVVDWAQRIPDSAKRDILAHVKKIDVHGYASTTGKVGSNQDLSRRRAQKVKQLLEDTLGPSAWIEIFTHGELQAGTPDETEDQNQRRVRMEYKTYVFP